MPKFPILQYKITKLPDEVPLRQHYLLFNILAHFFLKMEKDIYHINQEYTSHCHTVKKFTVWILHINHQYFSQ